MNISFDQNVGTDPTNSIRLYHALNGIRVILIDFWQHGPRYQRLMLWGVAAIWLAVMIPALGVLGMHMAERFL